MVKFGQKLQNNAVISWWEQGKYVNYKQLKKLIKALLATQREPSRRRSLSENLLSRIPSFRRLPPSVSPSADVPLTAVSINAGASVMDGRAGAPTEGTPLLRAEPSPEFEERAREEMKFSSPAVLSFVCPRESILHECEIIIIIIIARGTTRGASIEKRGEEMRFDDAKKRPRVASFVLLLLFSRVIISTCSVLTFLLEHTASA